MKPELWIDSKQVFRRRGGIEDCVVVHTMYDKCEYVSVKPQGPVFSGNATWTKFHEEFEPTEFDLKIVYEMLQRRAARQGATERAAHLLSLVNPALNLTEHEIRLGGRRDANHEGDTSMATAAKKKAAPDAAEKQPKTKAAAKPAKKAEVAADTGRRGRPGAYAVDAKIKVLVKENPKRGASAERFDMYKTCKTVGDYLQAGGSTADIRWDISKGYIEVA